MTFSPNGDETAPVSAVDLVVPSPGAMNGNTSGCEAADFAGFVPGHIALMQRGTCGFNVKAENAAAAGAVAAIVFNEGQTGAHRDHQRDARWPGHARSPAVGTTFAVGDELRNGVLNGPTGTTARVKVDRVNETRTTRNVIAETPGGDPNRVVVAGAHLDSVPRGPGNQRQRLRLGNIARGGGGVRRPGPRAAQQAAVHVVRGRGVQPARLGSLRGEPLAGRA